MNNIDLSVGQNKKIEADFFNTSAAQGEYNVFSDRSNEALMDQFFKASRLKPGAKVIDLGCGSGIFSSFIQKRNMKVVGVDLSFKMVERGKQKRPSLNLWNADVEALPFQSGSLDGVLASGLLHHLPNPNRCIQEIKRVLKPGGTFFAFDPNRKNPFMWLYRDKSSPFYSSNGVSLNERPVMAGQLARRFAKEGFLVRSDYMSLSYRYIASALLRYLLPLYNAFEKVLFMPGFLKYFRAMVLTSGTKSKDI